MPAIQRALGFDAAGLQWIFNAYVVALGGLLLLGGRLADLFGPRRLFAGGFVVLTAASLLAGLATTPFMLIATRAAQGVGAALIAPAALSMVMALFAARPAELRKALGFCGLASGVVNTTYQIGSAIGLAVMVAAAGLRTRALASTHDAVTAMNGGFSAAFAGAAAVAFAASLAALSIRTGRSASERSTAVLS